MKYHTPKMIIAIVVSLILVFLVVVSSILYIYGPYTPAMKLSESVITELEQGFGGWRIAFSFKDRTFLSKMELREVDVFFQEELVASFDNLELGETIFSALKSLITKDGNISISTEGSSFYVPPSSIDDLFLLFSGFLDSLRSGNLSLLDFVRQLYDKHKSLLAYLQQDFQLH